MMQGQSLARFIIGIIGNVASGFLFLSPGPTFLRILKNKTTEEFHPWPYIAALMNCMMWIFYGLPFVHPDSVLVVTINGFGFAMEIIYLTVFFIYTKPKWRKVIIGMVALELVSLAIIAVCVLHFRHTTDDRSLIVGILCVLFGLVMYGSPFSNVMEVIKMKSSEFMPLYLIIVGTVNGIIWFTYAFLKKFDPNIAIGNGVGALFGAFQLGLYFWYRNGKGTKKEQVEDVSKAGNVQLSTGVTGV